MKLLVEKKAKFKSIQGRETLNGLNDAVFLFLKIIDSLH